MDGQTNQHFEAYLVLLDGSDRDTKLKEIGFFKYLSNSVFPKALFFLDSAGVIEVLVNSGRQIDAVNMAYAFELTEKFSPVALLKSYMKEARKSSSPVKPGNTSPTVQVHGHSHFYSKW